MNNTHKIHDNKEASRFEITLEDDKAFIEYEEDTPLIYLTHTEVPEKYRGQGIASKMIQETLTQLLAEDRPVVAECPAIKKFVLEHPEFSKVVVD